MSIETLRFDEDTKRRLTSLKRKTGISQWNILGRWAFCTSLATGHLIDTPRNSPISSVEMTWKVFAGQNSEVYRALALHSHSLAKTAGFAGTLHDTITDHIAHGAAILSARKTSVTDCKSLLVRSASLLPYH